MPTHGHNRGELIRVQGRYEHWERVMPDGTVRHYLYNRDTLRWSTAQFLPI